MEGVTLPSQIRQVPRRFGLNGRRTVFVAVAVALWLVLPALFATLVLPSLPNTYDDMGLETWSPTFQQSMPGRALECVAAYAHWTRWGHFRFPLFVASTALVALALWGIHARLGQDRARRWFTWGVLGGGALWLGFLVVASLYPLSRMWTAIP